MTASVIAKRKGRIFRTGAAGRAEARCTDRLFNLPKRSALLSFCQKVERTKVGRGSSWGGLHESGGKKPTNLLVLSGCDGTPAFSEEGGKSLRRNQSSSVPGLWSVSRTAIAGKNAQRVSLAAYVVSRARVSGWGNSSCKGRTRTVIRIPLTFDTRGSHKDLDARQYALIREERRKRRQVERYSSPWSLPSW